MDEKKYPQMKSHGDGDPPWCCRAVILPGVTLGNNVQVGAGAVVTHSFPDRAVIAGVPARLLRQI